MDVLDRRHLFRRSYGVENVEYDNYSYVEKVGLVVFVSWPRCGKQQHLGSG